MVDNAAAPLLRVVLDWGVGLLTHGHNELGPVIADQPNLFADDPWDEVGFGNGVDEVLHLVPFRHGWVQPLILEVLRHDHRRAVMDVPERVMGDPGEDRRCHQPFVLRILGLGRVGPKLVLLPLVVPIGGDECAALGGRGAKGRLFGE